MSTYSITSVVLKQLKNMFTLFLKTRVAKMHSQLLLLSVHDLSKLSPQFICSLSILCHNRRPAINVVSTRQSKEGGGLQHCVESYLYKIILQSKPHFIIVLRGVLNGYVSHIVFSYNIKQHLCVRARAPLSLSLFPSSPLPFAQEAPWAGWNNQHLVTSAKTHTIIRKSLFLSLSHFLSHSELKPPLYPTVRTKNDLQVTEIDRYLSFTKY